MRQSRPGSSSDTESLAGCGLPHSTKHRQKLTGCVTKGCHGAYMQTEVAQRDPKPSQEDAPTLEKERASVAPLSPPPLPCGPTFSSFLFLSPLSVLCPHSLRTEYGYRELRSSRRFSLLIPLPSLGNPVTPRQLGLYGYVVIKSDPSELKSGNIHTSS